MMNAAQINPDVMARFRLLEANRRLAHAYLFVGPADCGKTQTALRLAQLVNCEGQDDKPCGACAPCLKIASGNHPDVHVIGNDAMESIKIEEIRYMLSRVQLMAYEGKRKVFIIRNIEWMTLDASNALLKTLEEPAPNTLMVLTTSVPEATLDTIKSRCHMIKFFPSPVNRVSKILAQEGVEEAEAHFLAVYTEGCLGKARKLAGEAMAGRKRKILDEMLLNRHNDTFLKELSASPQETVVALRIVLSFFRDVVLLKNGVSTTQLVHQDCLNMIEKFASRPADNLETIIRQIVQAKSMVDENLNVKMSLSLLREHLWAN